jgi:hypothetical protein
LVDGFDTPPQMMMPHGRIWYGPMLEARGYRPAKDLLAYWVDLHFTLPPVAQALLARYAPRIRMRPLNSKHVGIEMELLRDVFNDAWSENWGFVPFTREEFAELGQSLRLIVPDEMVQIAEVDGEAAAFVAALPNLNEVVKEIDGKLLPLGWLKVVNRLRKHQIKTGRVPLLGVRKRFHNTHLGIALAYQIIYTVTQEMLKLGIDAVEESWILENNQGMRHILESFGSEVYKRYRLYEKELSAGR